MKIRVLLCLTLLLVPAFGQEAPKRGKALYDVLRKRNLVTGGSAPSVTWLPDGNAYLVREKNEGLGKTVYMRVDPGTGLKSMFFDFDRLVEAHAALTGKKEKELPFRRFTFSDDGTRICFGSYDDGLVVYDLETHAMKRFPVVSYDGPRPRRSPDWTRMVFARGYDLYMVELETGKEVQLTEGGSEEIRNGRPDWVYPEEFRQNDAFWWSPGGDKVAFLRYDERPVAQYPLVWQDSAKGRLELIRYPKAGDANPDVTLHIVDVATRKIVDVDIGSENDVYIIRAQWTNDGGALTFQRLNRLQNVLELLAADPATGETRVLLREEEECFVNVTSDLTFLDDNEHFLWTSERSGWRQVYLHGVDGHLVRQLTFEELPVGSIKAVDEEDGWVYFSGCRNRGLDSHLFRVRLDGEDFECLTPEAGSHRTTLAPRGKWFFDTWSSINTSRQTVFRRGDGSLVREIGKADTGKIDALKLEPVELVTFKAADGVTDLHGVLFKPADFDAGKNYPLMVHVYGGPHSQTVKNQFLGDSSLHAEAQLGYIVFRMDNRGTVNRGKAFEVATYQKLGQVDLADQVAGVNCVTGRPYVDGSRVGVTGGSYGGYMTCMALLAAPDVFHVGVACSSVTHWNNYDTIYTERYMRRPQDNPDGYEKGAAMPYAKNLKGKLLLMHGTIDNNVHPSNTIQLVRKLVEEGKRFDLMFYPEHRHGIYGPAGRHLRRTSREYFARHLQPEHWEGLIE